MAREIRAFAPPALSGYTQDAPLVQPLAMPPRIVRAIDIRVPPGPRGLMGFALGAAGTIVFPYGAADAVGGGNPSQWFVADDENIRLELDGAITSGAWEFFSYNTGVYNHTVYLRFHVDPVKAPGEGVLAGVPNITGATV